MRGGLLAVYPFGGTNLWGGGGWFRSSSDVRIIVSGMCLRVFLDNELNDFYMGMSFGARYKLNYANLKGYYRALYLSISHNIQDLLAPYN